MLPSKTRGGVAGPRVQHHCAAGRVRCVTPRATLAVTSYASTSDRVGELGWRTDFGAQYVQGKCLGGGSFGVVYQGVDKLTGEAVAVKVMPKQRGKLAKEKTLEKLEREVSVFERVSGAAGRVVELIDCFEAENEVMLISELCSGGDLQRHLDASGPLDERALALVAHEVLLIIKACHDLGVLHGDIKPANFCKVSSKRTPLTSEDPTTRFLPWLKAIDFGCSQYLVGSRRLTKRTGTPVYMAPEIFQRDYGQAADMWSAGVMLYQLYCRRFPFWDNVEVVKASRLEEVADAVTNAPILYDFGPWLHMSKDGLDFIQRCLERDQGKRMSVDEALHHPWIQHAIADDWGMACSNNVVSSGMKQGTAHAA